MSQDSIQEELQKRMIHKDNSSGRLHSRHFALAALVLIGIAVFVVWKMRTHRVAPNSEPAETIVDSLPSSSLSSTDSSDYSTLSLTSALPDDLPVVNQPSAQVVVEETTTVGEPVAQTPPSGGVDFDYLASLATPESPEPRRSPENSRRRNSSRDNSPRPSQFADDYASSNYGGSETTGSVASGERVHIIKDGESLPELAARYYGSGSVENIRRIRNANPHLRSGGFHEGVPLKIPAAENSRSENGVAAVSDIGGSPVIDNVYTVVSGDTLSGISIKIFGSTARWRDIYQLNRDQLDAPEKLQVGMKLRLPEK